MLSQELLLVLALALLLDLVLIQILRPMLATRLWRHDSSVGMGCKQTTCLGHYQRAMMRVRCGARRGRGRGGEVR